MKYRVFHADNPTFFPPHPAFHNCSEVAIVECDDLEEVFQVTNNIDKPWWENPEVIWHKPNSRSTSVGDIVIDENDVQWRCESAGWKNKAYETVDPIQMYENLKVLVEQYIDKSPDFPDVEEGYDLAAKIGKAMGNLESALKGN